MIEDSIIFHGTNWKFLEQNIKETMFKENCESFFPEMIMIARNCAGMAIETAVPKANAYGSDPILLISIIVKTMLFSTFFFNF